MTEEKMCPAELMAKAVYEYRYTKPWETYKAESPDSADEMVKEHRIALRAFAVMERTEKMRDAYNSNFNTGADPVKAFLLAATDEGDQL